MICLSWEVGHIFTHRVNFVLLTLLRVIGFYWFNFNSCNYTILLAQFHQYVISCYYWNIRMSGYLDIGIDGCNFQCHFNLTLFHQSQCFILIYFFMCRYTVRYIYYPCKCCLKRFYFSFLYPQYIIFWFIDSSFFSRQVLHMQCSKGFL